MTIDPKERALLAAHHERVRTISTERQRILQQQAEVLRSHVRAGVQLPTATTGAVGPANRGHLIEQLTQEEAASRAALEALKQGSRLSRAREIATKVLQHQLDLSGRDNPAAAAAAAGGAPDFGALDHQLWDAAADGAAAGGGRGDGAAPPKLQHQQYSTSGGQYAGEAARNPAKSVFLLPPAADAALHADGSSSKGQEDDAERREGLAAAATVKRAAPPSARAGQRAAATPKQQRQGVEWANGPAGTGKMDYGGGRGAAAGGGREGVHSAGFASPDVAREGDGGAENLDDLRRQVAALQAAVEARLLPPAPAIVPLAGAWGPYATGPPWLGSPVYQQVPAVTQQFPTYMPQPQQQQQRRPWGEGAGSGGGGVVSLPAELASDPEVSAAHARHVRDMALLHMEVDRARTAEELERIRMSLAELRGDRGPRWSNQQPLVSPILPGLPRLPILEQSEEAAGYLQQQGTELEVGLGGQQGQEAEAAAAGEAVGDDEGHLQPGPAPDEDADLAALDAEKFDRQQKGGDLTARKGSDATIDVLRVTIQAAGPFSKRGTYRVAVALYDGFQPIEVGPGLALRAYTSRRTVSTATANAASVAAAAAAAATSTKPQGRTSVTIGSAAAAAAGSSDAAKGPANIAPLSLGGVGLTATWSETVTLRGVRLSSTTLLVVELHLSKPGVAGLPTREALVAWGFAPVLARGQVQPGTQSIPLFRLPLLLAARRKFTYDGALLDFRLTRYTGMPGDVDAVLAGDGALAPGPGRDSNAAGTGGAAEDIPGVSTEAWVRVQRGTPPSDPYTPGDGFVVLIDGARFLPSSVTITKVQAVLWSSSGQQLSEPIEGVALPEGGDALSPSFVVQGSLDVGADRFEDPTATIMFHVHTIERFTHAYSVVGFALLPTFLDPREGSQPISRSIRDYVLNQGAFQIPLHAGAPGKQGPLRASSLDSVPRIPCASLLVRVMTPEDAKLQRRKRPPLYADRVYDTTRTLPSAVEKRLFPKLLQQRGMAVREAARLAAYIIRGGRRRRTIGSSARVTEESPSYGGSSAVASTAAAAAAREAAPKGIFSLLLGTGGSAEAAGGAAVELVEDAVSDAADIAADLEDAKSEVLPPSDPEVMDWMADVLQGPRGSAPSSFIGFNTAREYQPDLGFFVAVDGAHRITRLLPTAALVSYAPPGSFYQDHPLVDDVKVTLDYDLSAPLAAPRWLDGYQQFVGAPYSPGLCVVIDVRYVVPAAGSSAPAGWALLPVFERCGAFVASGSYHLPLFQGVPGSTLLAEVAAKEDPHAVMVAQLKSGRIRPSLDFASVMVRMMCATRAGQLEVPAWGQPLEQLRLPRYAAVGLGAKHVAEMRKVMKNKTYSQAKPQALTDDMWVDQINDAVIKAAGLDEGEEDEGAAGNDEDREEEQHLHQQQGLAASAALGGSQAVANRAATGPSRRTTGVPSRRSTLKA